MKLPALFLGLCSLLASCSGLPIRPEPAELRTSLPLEYRASLSSQSPLAIEVDEAERVTSERRIEVRIEVRSCSPREAEAQLGALALGPTAWILSEDNATRLLASGGERLSAPSLVVFDGQRSHCAVTDQRAYVSRFEVSGDGTSMVADPVIDTVRHGLSFAVCARVAADDALELDLEWRLCELDPELPELTHALPLGSTPVMLQVPLVMDQQLTTHARLRAGECVVLSCRSADGRQRQAVVRASASGR